MADVPTYFAQQPLETSRLPRAPLSIADVGAGIEAQAIGQVGQALSQIAEKFQQAKDVTDVTEADTNALEEFSRLENLYALDQEYGTMFERWGKDAEKSRKTILKKKGLSGEARKVIEQRFDRDRIRFGNSIQDLVRKKQIQDGRAKYSEGLSSILKEGSEAAEDKAKVLIAGTKAAGFITAEQAQADRENIPKMLEVFQIEKIFNTNPAVAEGMIDAAEHLNPQEKNQLRSRARTANARLKKEQQEKYDAYVEQTEQDWLVKLRNTKLTEPEIMASTFTVDKKQEWLGYIDSQAKEILSGKDIITNQVVKSQLEDDALLVGYDAMSIEDFRVKATKARYSPDVPLDQRINDSAFDEVMTLARRELKTSQGNALGTAITEAGNELIDVRTEFDLSAALASLDASFKGDELKAEKQRMLDNRQLQHWWHGQYKKAMNEWFEERVKISPAPTEDDIYIEAKKKLVHYRGKTINEIKGLLQSREAELVPLKEPKPRRGFLGREESEFPEGLPPSRPVKVRGEEGIPVYKSKADQVAHKKIIQIWPKIPNDMKDMVNALRAAGYSFEEIIEAEEFKPYR